MFNNRKNDIILIQETHSTPESSRKWKNEWTGKSIWNSGPIPKSSGVAILFTEKSDIEIIHTNKDKEGRIIQCIIKYEQEILQIINIYSPTNPTDRKDFYINLQKFIDYDQKTIIAGDFNMIENLFLDRIGGNPNKTHTIGCETFKIVKDKLNLIDIWRKNNPFQKRFTYHNADNAIHSRLDRFYITKTIKSIKCQIIPNNISDHYSVSLRIQINKNKPKGPGIWKLNTSILTYKNFQNIFKQFWKDWQNEKTKYKTYSQWWEIGKLYIKTIIIEYCKQKNKEINNRYNKLIENINEEKLKPQPDYKKIGENQTELEDIDNYKIHGTIIRSKEKIILNEEKPTKYFFLQEKQKQNKKHIKLLKNKQGKTLTTDSEILQDCKKYFQNLYTKQNTCEITQNLLLKHITNKITNEQNNTLTKQIEITEIKEAIQSMENSKSPGIDGIPIEFYKEFIEIIKKDLLKIFNEILFTNKKTPTTWNQAMITLIPKKGDTDYLKYWRPISLLCVDYKILTKILANRLKHILPDIISAEQNCSIPNRTIFNNLFLIRDIISYTKQKNNHFYILQIDQEKAFDKIDRTFLYKTLEKMGFSPLFINFLQTLYKENISI